MPTRMQMAMLWASLAAGACGCKDTDDDSRSRYAIDKSDPRYCAGGRYDEATDLCWQHPEAADKLTWPEAVDYCANLDLEGRSDWTLPALPDFIGLLGGCDEDVLGGSFGRCDPCADSPKCASLIGAESKPYWTSSPSAASPNLAWSVPFGLGRVGYDHKSRVNHARCVRKGR